MKMNTRMTVSLSPDDALRAIIAGVGALPNANGYGIETPATGIVRIAWSRNRFRRGGLIGMAVMDKEKRLSIVANACPQGTELQINGETSNDVAAFLTQIIAVDYRPDASVPATDPANGLVEPDMGAPGIEPGTSRV